MGAGYGGPAALMLVVLVAGCTGSSSGARPPGGAPTASGRSASASPPADPRESPADILAGLADAYTRPVSMRLRGSIKVSRAAAVLLVGRIDPREVESSELVVGHRTRHGQAITRTLVAEGDAYVRGDGVPAEKGRPWLHVVNGTYPPGLPDEWSLLKGITRPGTYLAAMAEHGTAMTRREVRYDLTSHVLVRGTLASADVPSDMCAADRVGHRPDEVRFAVWVSTIDSVSKLVLDCRFHGRKPVVWTGRYAEERSYALELEPPRRSRITEPAKSA